jgi:hypothetical protein
MCRILQNYKYFYEVELNFLSPQNYIKYVIVDTVYEPLRIQDGQCKYCRCEALPCNHFCCGNVVSITYSELLSVTLAIQHAKGVGNIFSSVTNPAVQNISSLFNKRHDLPKTTH